MFAFSKHQLCCTLDKFTCSWALQFTIGSTLGLSHPICGLGAFMIWDVHIHIVHWFVHPFNQWINMENWLWTKFYISSSSHSKLAKHCSCSVGLYFMEGRETLIGTYTKLPSVKQREEGATVARVGDSYWVLGHEGLPKEMCKLGAEEGGVRLVNGVVRNLVQWGKTCREREWLVPVTLRLSGNWPWSVCQLLAGKGRSKPKGVVRLVGAECEGMRGRGLSNLWVLYHMDSGQLLKNLSRGTTWP